MSKLPPALLYLTIYNPTLQPTGPVDKDDEDAEEQAHILFYTARERAVSRDRMLRQVGLAKALVNFSSMFSLDESCESVHSQSRRMIMVCPEPNFWIHACFELAKTQKRSATSSNSKTPKGKQTSAPASKDSGKDKGRGKIMGAGSDAPDTVQWDWYDGSLHDEVLKRQLMKGYEQFKLIHGSFTRILEDQGPEVLEVQLERFFTVWAWKWDIDHDSEFGEHLGMPLHPLYPSIIPLIDEFAAHVPSQDSDFDSPSPFLLIPPHVIPSSSFSSAHPSFALPLYLRSKIPPPVPPSTSANGAPGSAKEGDAHASSPGVKEDAADSAGTAGTAAVANAFVAIGHSMDVRRWNWGALTFGKGGTIAGSPSNWSIRGMAGPSGEGADASGETKEAKEAKTQERGGGAANTGGEERFEGSGQELSGEHVTVDTESLHEAMSSTSTGPLPDSSPQTPSEPNSEDESRQIEEPTPLSASTVRDFALPLHHPPSFTSPASVGENDGAHSMVNSLPSASSSPSSSPETSSFPPLPESTQASVHLSSLSIPSPPSLPSFLPLTIQLAPASDPDATVRRRVLYTLREQTALAFISRLGPEYTDDEMSDIQTAALVLLDKVQESLEEKNREKNLEAAAIPSATKILQPKDRYVLDTGHETTISSPQFASTSEHLYLAQQALQVRDVLEVFSRTQSLQHWHMGKREPNLAINLAMGDEQGLTAPSTEDAGGAVMYMEISRKEASLADVDNELAEAIRKVSDEHRTSR